MPQAKYSADVSSLQRYMVYTEECSSPVQKSVYVSVWASAIKVLTNACWCRLWMLACTEVIEIQGDAQLQQLDG